MCVWSQCYPVLRLSSVNQCAPRRHKTFLCTQFHRTTHHMKPTNGNICILYILWPLKHSLLGSLLTVQCSSKTRSYLLQLQNKHRLLYTKILITSTFTTILHLYIYIYIQNGPLSHACVCMKAEKYTRAFHFFGRPDQKLVHGCRCLLGQ